MRVPQLPSDVHGVKTLEALSEMLVSRSGNPKPAVPKPASTGALLRIDHDIARPAETEFAPFYAGYIAKVGDRGPLAFLNAQVAEFEKLRGLAEAKGDYRYADGKWSVKEVLGHMADAERVFAYRLLRIARADKTPLAGFDENAWAEVAPHGRRTLADVVDDLIAVRRATIALVESLDEAGRRQHRRRQQQPGHRPGPSAGSFPATRSITSESCASATASTYSQDD